MLILIIYSCALIIYQMNLYYYFYTLYKRSFLVGMIIINLEYVILTHVVALCVCVCNRINIFVLL